MGRQTRSREAKINLYIGDIMTKEEFIKKWATSVFEKAGLTKDLSQQLDAEIKRDLDAVIKEHRRGKIK